MSPDYLTRTFPFTVRPGHRETLDSYTRRTLDANGEPESLPRLLLAQARETDSAATWEAILAAKVRRDLSGLHAAPVAEWHPGGAECAPCARLLVTRWACILCSGGAEVEQHPHLDDFVCEKHSRWIGPGSTPATQKTVSHSAVRAHRRVRKLRRNGRADLQLLLDVMESISEDLDRPAESVFDVAVEVMEWATGRGTTRRLFDPARSYSEAFDEVTDALETVLAGPTLRTSRAIWLHLWPAFAALQTAHRLGRSIDSHPHDFTLPEDITGWYPQPSSFQTTAEFLACTGDSALTATARLRGDDADEPSVLAPRIAATYCKRGHRFTAVIALPGPAEKSMSACPECARRYVKPGESDLASVAPAVANQLHPSLNGELVATDITARSSTVVWWVCKKSAHPFRASPMNRTLNGSDCAVCLNRVIYKGVNDFATTHPRLAGEFFPTRAGRKATELNATDKVRRRWLCPAGHEYRVSIAQRVRGVGCPDCEREVTKTSTRSLASTHPELESSWLPDLNEGREFAAYTKGSRVEGIWWCQEGQHPFKMRIQARTSGSRCPYCSGRLILSGFNDFGTTHPELAVDWHPWKNWKQPSDVMAGSIEIFEWRCRAGHERQQSIPNRIKSGGCVKCPRSQRAGFRG